MIHDFGIYIEVVVSLPRPYGRFLPCKLDAKCDFVTYIAEASVLGDVMEELV